MSRGCRAPASWSIGSCGRRSGTGPSPGGTGCSTPTGTRPTPRWRRSCSSGSGSPPPTTIAQTAVEDVETLRRCWYTGLLPSGKPLGLDDPALREHRQRWAMFRARQIQRTAIELLLRCFELAVGAGSRTVEAVVAHWRKRSPASLAGILSGTVRRLVQGEATAVTRETDIL